MISPQAFIHPNALVDDGASVGSKTRVWAFAHVVKGAKVGNDCNLCDHIFIEGKVTIGNNVTIKCGVYIWDGVVVEDDVFIGPAVVFTNDNHPRSKKYPTEYPRTLLQQGCSLGGGAVILPGITIGRWSMIGAGSVVTRDVPNHALVVGNPARFRAWVCRCAKKLEFNSDNLARCACGASYQLCKGEIAERTNYGT